MMRRKWIGTLLICMCAFAVWMYYLHDSVVETEHAHVEGKSGGDWTAQDIDAFCNAAIMDGKVVRTGSGGSIIFDLPDLAVSVIRLSFDQTEDVHFKVYYAMHGREFSETQMKEVTGKGTDGNVLIALPMEKLSAVQIEADRPYELVSMELFSEPFYFYTTAYVPRKMNLLMALLMAVLLGLVWMTADADWKSCRGFLFPVAHVILELAVIRVCMIRRMKNEIYDLEVELALLIAFTAATLVLCAVYRMVFVHHRPLYQVYVVCGMSLGLAMMLLIPPHCVPDEGTHFNQAYRRSNQMMFKQVDGSMEMREEDEALLKLVSEYGIDMKYRLYDQYMNHFTWFAQRSGNVSVSGVKALNTVPLGYTASAIGLTVSRLLGLSGMLTYYMGRLFNLMAFVAMTAAAIALIPFGKTAVFCLALFPMTIQLSASYSYDPTVIGFVFLGVAYILRLTAQKKEISPRQYGVLCVLAMLLAPNKVVYSPVLMLVFLIPASKFGFGRKKGWQRVLPVALGLAVAVLLQSALVMHDATNTALTWDNGAQSYTLSYVLHHIRETATIYLRTFENRSDFYFHSLICQRLGWLQVGTYDWLEAVYILLFALACQRQNREELGGISTRGKWGIILVGIISIMLVQASMLFGWTQMQEYGIIEGVQGRYLIPVMLLAMPVLRSSAIQAEKRMNDFTVMAIPVLAVFTMLRVLQTIPS